MFPAIYRLDLLLQWSLVRHHSCVMLRFKRVRCACTVSDGDHHNHTACLALEFSREPTLLSAHYCTTPQARYKSLRESFETCSSYDVTRAKMAGQKIRMRSRILKAKLTNLHSMYRYHLYIKIHLKS